MNNLRDRGWPNPHPVAGERFFLFPCNDSAAFANSLVVRCAGRGRMVMTQAIRKSPAAPADDQVGKAVEDPGLQTALVHHALAILSKCLARRAVADRME